MSLEVKDIKVDSLKVNNGIEIKDLLKIDNITDNSMDMNFFQKDLSLNLTGANMDTEKIKIGLPKKMVQKISTSPLCCALPLRFAVYFLKTP